MPFKILSKFRLATSFVNASVQVEYDGNEFDELNTPRNRR